MRYWHLSVSLFAWLVLTPFAFAATAPAQLVAAKPDNRGTADAPLAVKSDDLAKSAESLQVIAEHVKGIEAHESEDVAQERKKTFYEGLTGWATAALGIFTLLLAIATGFLARYTWKLWKATTDIVLDEQKTSEQELRAYVKVELRKWYRLNSGHSPIATFVLSNRGKTPARDIKAEAALVLMHFPLPDYPNLDEIPLTLCGHGVLFDRDETTATITMRGTITQNDLNLISGGTQSLYLICRVAYVDAFGKARTTDHVSYFGGIGGGTQTNGDGPSYYAPYGNRYS